MLLLGPMWIKNAFRLPRFPYKYTQHTLFIVRLAYVDCLIRSWYSIFFSPTLLLLHSIPFRRFSILSSLWCFANLIACWWLSIRAQVIIVCASQAQTVRSFQRSIVSNCNKKKQQQSNRNFFLLPPTRTHHHQIDCDCIVFSLCTLLSCFLFALYVEINIVNEATTTMKQWK